MLINDHGFQYDIFNFVGHISWIKLAVYMTGYHFLAHGYVSGSISLSIVDVSHQEPFTSLRMCRGMLKNGLH